MSLNRNFVAAFLIGFSSVWVSVSSVDSSSPVLDYTTVFSGDVFSASCQSSRQIAVWSWYGKSSTVGKILATGVVKHTRLNDDR